MEAAMAKWVYTFGDGKAEGGARMRDLLGGKGANLAEMANLGLPVPPGFTITTEVCSYFYQHGKRYPADLKQQVEAALDYVGKVAGHGFRAHSDPLLGSGGPGAPPPMPVVSGTRLDLGLHDQTGDLLAHKAPD